MSKKLKFSCGCELSDKQLSDMEFPDCPKTWELFEEGNTIGIFQLEKPLGQSWSKRAKPKSIEELAALISILRPGPLESGMADNYVKVARREIEASYLDESLRPILNKTHASLIYQEQSIQIAKELAGFSLSEADTLRKSLGKKDSALLAKVKTQFIEGIEKTNIVSKEVGEQIFNWIEKGQRYLFNRSHAVEYAITAYQTAYLKRHFPKEFFCAYLNNSRSKPKWQEELCKLVNNAQSMNIDIVAPNICEKNANFEIKQGQIIFGLSLIKNLGETSLKKLLEDIDFRENQLERHINEFTWPELLFLVLINVNSQGVRSLIASGSLRYLGLSRNQLLFEYQKLEKLSSGEIEILRQNCVNYCTVVSLFEDFNKLKKEGGAIARKDRIQLWQSIIDSLKNPPIKLADSATYISNSEVATLGVSLSTHSLLDFKFDSVTHTCEEANSVGPDQILLAINIEEVKPILIKKGKNAGAEMAFLEVSDDTGRCKDIVIFPDQWAEYQYMLIRNNKVYISCEKTKKGSYAVKKIQQLTNSFSEDPEYAVND